MTLREFISVLNFKVKYRITDHYDNHKEIPYDGNQSRKIYLVFQDNNGTLQIDII